jgi:hypothetical protein
MFKDLFFFPFPQANNEVKTYSLVIDLTYKDNGIRETVCFQSFNVFSYISDEVNINSWKYIRSDGEVLTEGVTLDSLQVFFSDIDENVKKLEN